MCRSIDVCHHVRRDRRGWFRPSVVVLEVFAAHGIGFRRLFRIVVVLSSRVVGEGGNRSIR